MVQVKCFQSFTTPGSEPANPLAAVRHAMECGTDWILVNAKVIENRAMVASIGVPTHAATGENSTKKAYGTENAGKNDFILLEDVVEAIEGRAGLTIQMNGPDTSSCVVREIHKAIFRGTWKYSKFLVSAENFKELDMVRCYDPNIRVGCILLGVPYLAVKYAERIGAHSVFVNKLQLTPDLAAECRERGLQVIAHTINSEEEYLLMEEMGVDGVVCDFPEKVVLWRFLGCQSRPFEICE